MVRGARLLKPEADLEAAEPQVWLTARFSRSRRRLHVVGVDDSSRHGNDADGLAGLHEAIAGLGGEDRVPVCDTGIDERGARERSRRGQIATVIRGSPAAAARSETGLAC